MTMKTFAIFLAVTIGLVQAATTPAPACMSDSDCSQSQCCYKKHEFLVVSKRGNTFEGYPILTPRPDLAHTQGVCQSYHAEGDSCTPYDKTNGYCSCNEKEGHSCQYEAPSNGGELLASKRALPPGYGRYVCKKQLMVVS